MSNATTTDEVARVAAHTPGPWRISDPNCGGGQNIVDAKGRTVAHTARFFNAAKEPINEPESRANARLVAESPTLLSLCINAAFWTTQFMSVPEVEALHQNLEAAIKRATGGTE